MVDGHTNREGEISFHVLPGTFSVEVGAGRLAVTARPGVATPVVMRPAGEGDLLFELPDNSPRFKVRRVDGESLDYHDRQWWAYATPARRQQGYRYLPAGEYEVLWVRSSGWPVAGTARVVPGQVTFFRGPPGGLHVLLRARKSIDFTLHVERLENLEWSRFVRIRELGIVALRGTDIRLCSPYMPPGRYRVWAESRDVEWAPAEVVVGDSMVDLVLHPEEAR